MYLPLGKESKQLVLKIEIIIATVPQSMVVLTQRIVRFHPHHPHPHPRLPSYPDDVERNYDHLYLSYMKATNCQNISHLRSRSICKTNAIY